MSAISRASWPTCNLAIGVHRQDGHTHIAAALRHIARDWRRPLGALGLTG
ncbi:hypothetical protein ABT116_32005 [Streptomyces sp. NPDC002130]